MPIELRLRETDALSDILRALEDAWSEPQGRIRVDLSGYAWAHPHQLVAVIALVKRLKLIGSLIRPSDPNVDSYMSRMDFYRQLGLPSSEGYGRRDPGGRFVEITRLTYENQYRVASNMARVIQSAFGVSRGTMAGLNFALAEIVDNVFAHAESSIGGWVAAQNYSDRVEMCIIDGGRGIRESLCRNQEYAELDNASALEHAIRKSVTGNRSVNQGAGLYFTSELLRLNEGRFELYSGEHSLLIDGGGYDVQEVPYWGGTIVQMTFLKNENLDERTLQRLFRGQSTLISDALSDGELW